MMRLSLHHRIVLPLAAVAVLATSAVAWVAYGVTTTIATTRTRESIDRAASVASRAAFALNPQILTAIRQATGADVVVFSERGVLSTTIDARDSALVSRVTDGLAGDVPQGDVPLTRRLVGEPTVVVSYSNMDGRPGAIVAVLKDTTDLDRANDTLRNTMLVATLASLIIMIVASQLIARRVTAPIERLARFAERVSAAETHDRAEEGVDEVGRLGAAFNGMLERLDAAQAAIVNAEKLGIAGLMAARVAHDVRNPLSSIKMQTQLLHASLPPGSESRDMTEAMLHDIAQVELVVGGLLEVAKPSGLHRAPHALNAIIEGVLQQVTPQCRHRRITIERHLAPDLPTMSLDADRLRHALLNIVLNATEALREGGTLSVWSRVDRGDALILVEDDGVGLDAAAAQRVFDPFVTTKPGGVGLGLVNARAAIESHGGTIALSPRDTAGTRATIRLPLVSAASSSTTSGAHG